MRGFLQKWAPDLIWDLYCWRSKTPAVRARHSGGFRGYRRLRREIRKESARWGA